jgi:hypothetical protein
VASVLVLPRLDASLLLRLSLEFALAKLTLKRRALLVLG